MKRLAQNLLRLYPKRWRDRYASEFETLLEDLGSVWPHFPDILLTALKMRFRMLNWRFVGAFALVGLVLAGGLALLSPARSVVSAELECVAAEGVNPQAFRLDTERIIGQILDRRSVAEVIQNPSTSLYWRERASLPMEDVILQFRNRDFHYQITSHDPGHIRITISLTSDPAYHLQAAVASMLKRALTEHADLSTPPTRDGGIWGAPIRRNPLFGSNLHVRVAPSQIQSTGHGVPVIAGAGLGFGVLLGLLAALIRRRPAVCLLAGAVSFTLGVCSLGLPLLYEARATFVVDSPERRAIVVGDAPLAFYSLHAKRPPQLLADPSGTGLIVVAKDPNPFRAQSAAQEATTVLMNAFTRRYRQTEPGDDPLFGIVQPPKLPSAANGEVWRTVLLGSGAVLLLIAGVILIFDQLRFRDRLGANSEA